MVSAVIIGNDHQLESIWIFYEILFSNNFKNYRTAGACVLQANGEFDIALS